MLQVWRLSTRRRVCVHETYLQNKLHGVINELLTSMEGRYIQYIRWNTTQPSLAYLAISWIVWLVPLLTCYIMYRKWTAEIKPDFSNFWWQSHKSIIRELIIDMLIYNHHNAQRQKHIQVVQLSSLENET
jgi:hypothetical protein